MGIECDPTPPAETIRSWTVKQKDEYLAELQKAIDMQSPMASLAIPSSIALIIILMAALIAFIVFSP